MSVSLSSSSHRYLSSSSAKSKLSTSDSSLSPGSWIAPGYDLSKFSPIFEESKKMQSELEEDNDESYEDDNIDDRSPEEKAYDIAMKRALIREDKMDPSDPNYTGGIDNRRIINLEKNVNNILDAGSGIPLEQSEINSYIYLYIEMMVNRLKSFQIEGDDEGDNATDILGDIYAYHDQMETELRNRDENYKLPFLWQLSYVLAYSKFISLMNNYDFIDEFHSFITDPVFLSAKSRDIRRWQKYLTKRSSSSLKVTDEQQYALNQTRFGTETRKFHYLIASLLGDFTDRNEREKYVNKVLKMPPHLYPLYTYYVLNIRHSGRRAIYQKSFELLNESSQQIIQEMNDYRIPIDDTIYTDLMTSYLSIYTITNDENAHNAAKRWRDTAINESTKGGIAISMALFTPWISGYIKLNKIKELKELFTEITSTHIKGNNDINTLIGGNDETFSIVATYYITIHDFDAINNLIQSREKLQLFIPTTIYQLLLDEYLKVDRLDDASKIETIMQNKLKEKYESFMNQIKHDAMENNANGIQQIIDDMKIQQIIFDEKVYETLITAYLQNDKTEEALLTLSDAYTQAYSNKVNDADTTTTAIEDSIDATAEAANAAQQATTAVEEIVANAPIKPGDGVELKVDTTTATTNTTTTTDTSTPSSSSSSYTITVSPTWYHPFMIYFYLKDDFHSVEFWIRRMIHDGAKRDIISYQLQYLTYLQRFEISQHESFHNDCIRIINEAKEKDGFNDIDKIKNNINTIIDVKGTWKNLKIKMDQQRIKEEENQKKIQQIAHEYEIKPKTTKNAPITAKSK